MEQRLAKVIDGFLHKRFAADGEITALKQESDTETAASDSTAIATDNSQSSDSNSDTSTSNNKEER